MVRIFVVLINCREMLGVSQNIFHTHHLKFHVERII